MKKKSNEFGYLRNMLFPIHTYELKKFVPLAIVFFCICYNYSALRGTKDIFILGKSGAEAIYYLKAFGVTPAIFLFTIAYTFISKSVNRDQRFNIIVLYFITFFASFLFLFLPYAESLKLNSIADWGIDNLPKLKGFWSIIRNWHTSLFYVHAEAWGSYVMGVLFWTFANEIVSLKQSKRFYSFLLIGANIGATAAGISIKHIFHGNAYLTIGTVLSLAIICLLVYNYYVKQINSNPKEYEVPEAPIKKKKLKLSFGESMKFLFGSPYLMLIAILVLSYGISIALFEAVWKDRLQVYAAGDKRILSSMYGDQLTYIGISTILFLVVLSPWIRKRSWNFMALITPMTFFIGSILFFAFMFFGDFLTDLIPGDSNTLALAVFIGLGNVVLIKSSKYAFFDPSKEMSYIPLDEESKVRGKAAVDGVGSRLGKSLGSILITFVYLPISGIIGDGSIGAIKHIIAINIIIVLVIWIFSVLRLGVKFNKVVASHEEEKNKLKEVENSQK